MSFWRVAAGLVVLFCFLTTLAAGADVTYSGVPGKWKKGSKVTKDKDKTADSEAQTRDPQKEKGKKTITIPAPTVSLMPGKK